MKDKASYSRGLADKPLSEKGKQTKKQKDGNDKEKLIRKKTMENMTGSYMCMHTEYMYILHVNKLNVCMYYM